MKKITFILFALLTGTAFAQNSATGTADAQALIVQPLSVEIASELNFGAIAPNGNEEDVVLSPANLRDIQPDMLIPGNTTTTVPTFTIIKESSLTYKIVTSKEDLKLTGAPDILVKDITTSLATETTSFTANTFTVGATITVAADQPAGEYKGSVSVTVTYE